MKQAPFCGQVVIITGASAGIGKALALQLAAQGAKLVLAARRADRLEEVAAECRQLGGSALAVPTDVSLEEQCRALVERTIAEFGRLDMLINNAGLTAIALLDDFPDLHLFRHVMEVNFFGQVHCTYYALPYLKQTQGRIVSISSLGGKAALPYNTPYISSKFALHGFYDSLRMEVASHGVSITVICPSWVVSEFHEAQLDKNGIPRGEKGRAIYTRKTMTAERCAEITLNAARKRRREVVMSPGTLAGWLRLLAPGLLDWFTIKMFLEPIIRRAKKERKEARP